MSIPTSGIGGIGGIAGIADVIDRLATIESRFSPAPAEPKVVDLRGAAEFDPFGEAYQQAVEQARRSIPPAPQAIQPFGAYRPETFPRPTGTATAPPPSSEQIAAAIGGIAGAPGQRPIGGYGPMPVPGELVALGNGQVPAGQLAPLAVQPGHRLHAPAAAAWDALVGAAAGSGLELRITDSYRSHAEQVDLAARKGLYSEGGLAARPGTSNHGWGLAVDADVTDPAMLDWLRVNAPRFGWVEAVPREPWHWEFRPNQV